MHNRHWQSLLEMPMTHIIQSRYHYNVHVHCIIVHVFPIISFNVFRRNFFIFLHCIKMIFFQLVIDSIHDTRRCTCSYIFILTFINSKNVVDILYM